MQQAAVGVIGGGILGLTTAYHLTQRFPQQRVVILEMEATLAQHQTGHNSGVLHSGIYYKPGSLKATNCREGKKAMEAFCATEGIDYEICGKVIVATNDGELPALQRIYERGQANGVRCALIDAEHLHELEPAAAGIKAIHVPETGIVNYRQVCEHLAARVQERGGRIVTNARVTGIRQQAGEVVLQTLAGDFTVAYVVNCAGLHSDRVAALSGEQPGVKIVPFRGEYYEVKPHAQHVCRNLIYPVPDPGFPFLGVHFTRMITGGVECGPNAVLALAREGYHKTDINLRDLAETLTYPGFLRLAATYWQTGLGEMWRSFSKAAFVKALQHLIPAIQAEDLESAPAGIRAQAIAPDGALVDDFMFHETARIVNVCNAPSPAATASLNIGRLIVDKLAERFT
jgi:L-2-hydroxyglutarate oxidase